MLNLSGLRQSHDNLFAFEFVPGETISRPDDDLGFVRRLVACLELGGIGAMAIDTALATVAMNGRGKAIVGRGGGERSFKQQLHDRLAKPTKQSTCFLWHRPGRPLVFVRGFRLVAEADGLIIVLLEEAGECDALRLAAFIRHHGITPAETKVLEALLRGDAPGDIATRFDLSLATVKTQLGSLFARTGTNRQAALLARYHGTRWDSDHVPE